MDSYNISKQLPAGIHGKLFLVQEKTTEKDYAMKKISTGSKTQEQCEEIMKALNKYCQKESSNVIEIKSCFLDKIENGNEKEKEIAIVMEYCKTGSLSKKISEYKDKNEKIPEETISKWIIEIILGIRLIHLNGVAHANLKPENVLFDNSENLKVSDFGISSLFQTSDKVSDFSFRYSSPEKLKGEECTFSADIWSLGCIAYELCCFRPPYVEENASEMLYKIASTKINPKEIPKEYSNVLATLIISMLSKDPKERPTIERLLETAYISSRMSKAQTQIFIRKIGEIETKREAEPKVKVEKITYSDGSIYEGQTKGEKRHGTGILCYGAKSKWAGDKYEGMWSEDKTSGEGTYYYSSGDKYVGQWNLDKKNGPGIYYYKDGDRYEGEYMDGNKNGLGIYYYSSGAIYNGQWKDDKKNGQGTYTYSDGDKYIGEYLDDKKCGNGTYHFINGTKYEGQWKEDRMNGKGVYIGEDEKYDGQWKDGMKHGLGTYHQTSGDKYEGEYKEDNKDGKGTYFYANGNRYEGQWRNDKANGEGISFYANGDKYQGQWKDDKMEGRGIFYYASGSKYDGEWKDNNKSGPGVYYYTDGKKFVGHWENNNRNGKGTYYHTNGTVEEIMYKNGIQMK